MGSGAARPHQIRLTGQTQMGTYDVKNSFGLDSTRGLDSISQQASLTLGQKHFLKYISYIIYRWKTYVKILTNTE